MKKPIQYYGGKHFLTGELLKLIPPHKVYLEVFGGGCSLLFNKPPSEIEVLNDIYEDLINFYRILQDPVRSEIMHYRATRTLYSRNEYYTARKKLADRSYKDDIERAYCFLVCASMSFAGILMGGWGFNCRENRNAALCWQNRVSDLPIFHQRLLSVQIEQRDFEDLFKIYDNDDVFAYLDPPYLHSTRKDIKNYKYEMSDEDHIRLLTLLKTVKCKWLLSGYRNELYDRYLADYYSKDFKVFLCAKKPKLNAQRDIRIETIWANYDFNNQMLLFGESKVGVLFNDDLETEGDEYE